MLYTLNLYSAISQLYLNKAEKEYYVCLNYSLKINVKNPDGSYEDN